MTRSVAGFVAIISGSLLAVVLAAIALVGPPNGMPMYGASLMDMHATMRGYHMGGGMMWRAGGSGPGASAVPGAPEVRVEASNFAFAPREIHLPKGTAVNLTLANTSAVTHDLTVPGLGIHIVAGPGESRTIGLTGLASGRYDAYCSVPGHADLGMRAAVVVE